MCCLLVPRGVDVPVGSILIDCPRVIFFGAALALAGKINAGVIRFSPIAADWLMLGHVALTALSGLYHQGLREGAEITMQVITDMGLPYFVARAAIDSIGCYRFYVRVLLTIAVICSAFALVEMVTGHSVVRQAYHLVFHRVTHLRLEEQRLGLYRSIATFRHWILFGVYCSTVFALAVHMTPESLGLSRIRYRWMLGSVLVGVFASLSSGPWIGILLCACLMLYGRVMKGVHGRWKLFGTASVIVFVGLTIVSNRGPIRLAMDYLTLDSQTAYVRWGMWESVIDLMPTHWPIGWGWNPDWPRLEWYIWTSMDSFYAVQLVRSGVIAVVFLLLF